MSLYSIKLRIASILAGIAIAFLATFIILGVLDYFFGIAITSNLILLILILFLIMDVIQWLISPYIVGRVYHTKEIFENDPQYFWIVESVKKVSALNRQKVPRVFIANVMVPNAFAFGSPLSGRRLAITSGLLTILTRDEIEAVLGHEIGHLKHHDIGLIMAIGLIPTLILYFGYSILFTGGGRRGNNGSIFLIAMALVAMSFVFNLMILGVNRMRESYADMNSAETVPGASLTLQTAVAKIEAGQPHYFGRQKKHASSSPATMLMFSDGTGSDIYAPHMALLNHWRNQKVSLKDHILSNHPHPARRVQKLEEFRKRHDYQ